jgi:N-acetylmuramoyl-L-alanine amidase
MTVVSKVRPRALALALVLAWTQTISFAQTATPQSGEGIWGLLRRSGISPTGATAEAFRSLNADRLNGSDDLLRGVTYRLPGTSDSATPATSARVLRRYPILGKQHELVERKSSALRGHVYYIVSGHGGPDPGTNTSLRGRKFTEDEIAYDTALRLTRRLLEEGAKVYVIVRDPNDGIRDSEYLPADQDEVYLGGGRISRRQSPRLQARADIINELYDRNRSSAISQQVISLHVDAYGSGTQPQIDVHFAYASSGGRALGRTLQSEMRQQYELHQPGRGYSGRVVRRDWMILNATKPVAILVELGNIRHRGDQIRLAKPGNRQALAEWIAEGLMRKAGVRRAHQSRQAG